MSKSTIATPTWQKSSRSADPDRATCVEVAAIDQFSDTQNA
ncbi:MAG: DUF397 domain-containing protein [Actinoallomurus sp.]